MASLNCAKAATYYSAPDQSFHKTKWNDMYSNKNAIAYTIHYVTRTGNRIDRVNELVAYGCSGVCDFVPPEYYISMFEMIQKYMRQDRKITAKVSHEILSFDEHEEAFLTKNRAALLWYARACSEVYLNLGFLAVFGIHYGIHGEDNENCRKSLHIHFIINNVSHVNGNLFHSKIASRPFSPGKKIFFRANFGLKERESQMHSILYGLMQEPNPFQVDDPQDYISNAYNLYPRNGK